MPHLHQRIERLAALVGARERLGAEELWRRWDESTQLQRELWALLLLQPGSREAAMGRQTLRGAREALKAALAEGIRAWPASEEPEAGEASTRVEAVLRRRLEIVCREADHFVEGGAQAGLVGPEGLLAMEEASFLGVVWPHALVAGEEEILGPGALGAALRLRSEFVARFAEPGSRGEAMREVLGCYLADLEERLKTSSDLDVLWATLCETLTADAAAITLRGRTVSRLATLTTRMEWLLREADSPAVVEGLLRARSRLVSRRLVAYDERVGALVGAEPLDLQVAWNWLQGGAQLSAEAEEVVEALRLQGCGGDATALGALSARHDDAMDTLRVRLGSHARRLGDGELEEWRAALVDRCDDVMAQVAARSLGWGANALADARYDLKWLSEEYGRRLGAQPAEPRGTLAGELTVAGKLTHAGAHKLQKATRDISEEYYERMLQTRLARLLTPQGARALELLIFVLIVVILALLGFQLSLGGGLFATHHEAAALAPGVSGRPTAFAWTRLEIVEPWLTWLESVDAIICIIFLLEFATKLCLSESRWWYFRRRWFTDLLPSLPLGALLNLAAANYITALRTFGLLRVVRALRVVRLVSLLQRVSDRLVRKLRGVFDVRVVLFDDRVAAPAAHSGPRKEAEQAWAWRLTMAAFSRLQRLLGERESDERRTFWRRQVLMACWEVERIPDDVLRVEPPHAHNDQAREIRLEALIERLKHVDSLQVEAMLGSVAVRQLGNYLKFLAPLHRPILGIRSSLRQLNPGEAITIVGVAAAHRLEAIFEHVVNYIRDLYGIVTIPEFLSFVGGFCSKVFKRHRNRLFIGLFIVLVSLMLISWARHSDRYIVKLEVPSGTVVEAQWKEQIFHEEAERLRGTVITAILRHEDRATTVAATLRVPQYQFVYRAEVARTTLVGDLQDRLHEPVTILSLEERKAVLGAIGIALRNSFGAVLLIVGAFGFMLVTFGNWLMNRAGQMVDQHTRIAEAHFINLMKDYKRRHVSRDLGFLARRVLRPTLSPGEILENQADALLETRLRRRVERTAGLSDLPPLPEPHPGTIDLEIDRITLLYRDNLDGGLLHRSDVKTTEQLLGNLTILQIQDDIGMTAQERLKLEKLELWRGRSLFGPFLWFNLITSSISQKIGRLVIEFNKRSGTNEFTALHLLSPDPAREVMLASVYGQELVSEMRRARRDLIRSVFGTYPVHRRTVNPYTFYRERYEGGIRIFRVPIDVVLLVGWALMWPPRRFVGILRDFMAPERALPAPSPHAGIDVAWRKINRMRRPAYMAALEIRARFDLAYLDLRLPGVDLVGCQGDTFREDLDLIQASAGERLRLEALRAERDDLVRELSRHLEVAGQHLEVPHGTTPAQATLAWYTAYALRPELRQLMRAEHVLLVEVPRHAGTRRPKGFAAWRHRDTRIAWLRWRWHRWCLGWWRPGALRVVEVVEELAKARPELLPTASHMKRLEWACVTGDGSLFALLDACSKRQAFRAPRAMALAALEQAGRRCAALAARLTTIRSVQSIAVIDVLNYRQIVRELGEFAPVADEMEPRLPMRTSSRGMPAIVD